LAEDGCFPSSKENKKSHEDSSHLVQWEQEPSWLNFFVFGFLRDPTTTRGEPRSARAHGDDQTLLLQEPAPNPSGRKPLAFPDLHETIDRSSRSANYLSYAK
jgi:hypothetical protein